MPLSLSLMELRRLLHSLNSDGRGKKGVQVGVCSGMRNLELIWLALWGEVVGFQCPLSCIYVNNTTHYFLWGGLVDGSALWGLEIQFRDEYRGNNGWPEDSEDLAVWRWMASTKCFVGGGSTQWTYGGMLKHKVHNWFPCTYGGQPLLKVPVDKGTSPVSVTVSLGGCGQDVFVPVEVSNRAFATALHLVCFWVTAPVFGQNCHGCYC